MPNTHNLTEGPVGAHLVRLAAPLILGNILQQFYNTIDALVIGHFAGSLEFAAIGVAGSVMNLFLFAVVGACTGISVIFAQLYGAGDMASFRKEHFLSLVFGLLCTAAGTVAGTACLKPLLALIRTPGEIAGFAACYLSIVLAALPAAFLYNLYCALLRAVGRTRAALAALTVAVGANLFLDLLFVAKLGMGIAGAAWATAAAQVLSAVLCLLYLRTAMPGLLFRHGDCRLSRRLLRQTVHYGLVTGLHQSGLYIGKLLVQGAVNSAGTAVISAYTATTRIEGFANSFGDSGAAATSVVVAQNLGAGRHDRVRRSFFVSLRLLFFLGITCSAVMFATSDLTVHFMLGDANAAAFGQARKYIQTIAVFYTLCFTGNTFAGYFDGCGRVTIPFVGAISHIALRVVLSWMLVGRMGLYAVAVATGIGWILVNGFWALVYRSDTAKKSILVGGSDPGL